MMWKCKKQNKRSEMLLEYVPVDKSRLLVVDDNLLVRSTFDLILSVQFPGCTLDFATNGQEAVESFKAGHHGILIMDIRMPVMDGYTAFCEIQRICQENRWEIPSVIFCTAAEPLTAVCDLVGEDPSHCLLHKPIRNSVLFQALKDRSILG